MNGFIIAAPRSGSGKTSVTISLMKALSEKGDVVPFKVGPDYIDPMFHKLATNKSSYNLDLQICNEETVKTIFFNNCSKNSIAIVEGVMGLFDGSEEGKASSAHLAQVLDLPIILVIDARGLSTSIAAIVQGFKEFKLFNKTPNIAGIILNKVSSSKVFDLLKLEIENHTQIPVFGFLPKDKNLSLNSRHLGLIPPDEIKGIREKIQNASKIAQENIDLELLLKSTKIENKSKQLNIKKDKFKGLSIGIAYDEAFNFYYQSNLDLLKSLGVKLKYFSPLEDKKLPKEINALYLGGGFPEIFFEELEKNIELKEEIKEKLNNGLYCYAECGGLIYLSDICHFKDQTYKGVGFFKNEIEMTNRLQNFGYKDLYFKDLKLPVHEFHHSRLLKRENLKAPFYLKRKGKENLAGQLKKNTIAGYPHIHFLASPDGIKAVERFLEAVKNGKRLSC